MEIRIRELEMTINAQNKVIDELQSKNQEISSTPVLQSKTELLMNFSAVDPVPSLKIAQTVVEGLKVQYCFYSRFMR